MIGTVWFALASLLCGLAPNPEVLIAARVLQGVGGALLTPGSLAMIQGAFVHEDRAPAIGAWSGLGGIAAAIGPFVGGALVEYAELALDLPDQPAARRVTVLIAVRGGARDAATRTRPRTSTSPGRSWPPPRSAGRRTR